MSSRTYLAQSRMMMDVGETINYRLSLKARIATASCQDASTAGKLQGLGVPPHPLVCDPLGPDQDRAPTVDSQLVRPAVGVEVPPEGSAALLRLDCHPCIWEDCPTSKAHPGDVSHHCCHSVSLQMHRRTLTLHDSALRPVVAVGVWMMIVNSPYPIVGNLEGLTPSMLHVV